MGNVRLGGYVAFRSILTVAVRLLGALLQRIAILLIVAVFVFALMELAPGDAADAYLATTGGHAVFAAQLRDTLGISGTILERFATFMVRALTLDPGLSAAFGRPIADLILERLGPTLLLMASALFITAMAGTILGSLAGLAYGRFADPIISAVVLVLNATPGFLIALCLILAFAVHLGWLPVTSARSLEGSALSLSGFVLPVATLSLTYLALYVRVVRTSVIATRSAGFVMAARARGVRGRRLVLRHRMAFAAFPVVTLFGLQAGAMFGGSVVVETIFAIPGFGSLALSAVINRDIALLAAVLLCAAVMVIMANAVADAVYPLVDPRVQPWRGTQ